MAKRRTWDTIYQEVKQCVEETGQLPNEQSFNQHMQGLAAWVKEQRRLFQTGRLTKPNTLRLMQLHPHILNPPPLLQSLNHGHQQNAQPILGGRFLPPVVAPAGVSPPPQLPATSTGFYLPEISTTVPHVGGPPQRKPSSYTSLLSHSQVNNNGLQQQQQQQQQQHYHRHLPITTQHDEHGVQGQQKSLHDGTQQQSWHSSCAELENFISKFQRLPTREDARSTPASNHLVQWIDSQRIMHQRDALSQTQIERLNQLDTGILGGVEVHGRSTGTERTGQEEFVTEFESLGVSSALQTHSDGKNAQRLMVLHLKDFWKKYGTVLRFDMVVDNGDESVDDSGTKKMSIVVVNINLCHSRSAAWILEEVQAAQFLGISQHSTFIRFRQTITMPNVHWNSSESYKVTK
jgi:hypothetical protein